MQESGQIRGVMLPLAVAMLCVLSACSWLGKDDDEEAAPRLSGERLTVMGLQSELPIDAALAEVPFRGVEPVENLSWPQRGANPANVLGAVKISGLDRKDSTSIGEGEDWDTVLVTTPVVADGVIYAMDGHGYIGAYQQTDLNRVWTSRAVVEEEDEAVLGGGLAVVDTQLFVTTGRGRVAALNTADGTVVWERNLVTPIRAAPKMRQGIVYVSTIDDQLFALDGASGKIRWQHHGLGGQAGFLTAVSPAIGENIVVVTYSTGDIYGIAADSGQELWNDSLALTRRTSATSVFSGFDGDAVIAGGVAFASSNNGLSAATHLLTGNRIWEQEISAADTPWLAGNYLFMVTSDAQVAAVYARDGRVKWATQLEQYGNPERKLNPYHWYGPMLLGEQLVVFGGHGEAVLLSPEDGAVIGRVDVPKGIRATPIVAGGAVYVVTQDATLHVLR